MVLTTVSAKAVDVIEEGVDYYIMNVETDFFFCGQNNWGTQGTVCAESANLFQFVKDPEGEGYNLVNQDVTTSNKNLGGNLYVDGNGQMYDVDPTIGATAHAYMWRVDNLGGGIFRFWVPAGWYKDGSNNVQLPYEKNYLTKSETKGSSKGYVAEFTDGTEFTDASLFRVMTPEEAKAYMIDKAQSSNVSFNFLIKNPDFCRNQSVAAWGFTALTSGTNHNYAGGANNNFCAESYRQGFVCNQKISGLPAGRYQLSAQGFYRDDLGVGEEIPYIYVGNAYNDYIAKSNIILKTTSENSMTDASNSFSAGKFYLEPVRFNLDEAQDVEIGFCSTTNKAWVIWDNIQVKSYSNVKEYGEEYLAGITYPIEGLASADVRRAYEQAYRNFATFVADIQQGVQTFDDVDAEYAAFTKAEKALKASIESWSSYTVVAEKAKTLYEQITVQEGKYKPNTALNALNSYINAAAMAPGESASGYTFVNGNYAYIASNASLNAENVASEIDFVNSLMNDVKRNSVQDGMDVTFLLTNADFKDPNVGEGWTRQSSGSVNWNLRSGLSGWPVSETYISSNGGTFDIFQVVEGAPAGLYKVTVNAFHRPAGAWDAETKVPVALYLGSIANPIQNIAKGAIKNDLVWSDEEQKYLDGGVAKNGTNCYFWDGNSARSDADKAAIWAGNQNPDPEIQALISGSTSLTGAGKYLSDSQYNESYLIPNGMDGASIAFSAGRYPMVVYGEVPDEGDGVGTLKIGLKTLEPLNSGAWTLWGGFKLELAGTDPGAMKDLLKGKIDEMKALVPDATDAPGIAGVVLDSISNITSDAEALYNNPVQQDYEDYKEAYDALEHLIGSANKYLEAYSKLSADLTSLNNMISAFNADTPAKQALKAKAESVADVYTNLPAINCICLTPEDLENDKIWEDEVYGGVPEDVTNDNLADAAASGQDGGYVTTYSQFNAFYAELVQQLDCIYLKVDGTSLADDPQEITRQLRNPDLVTEDQWWGTSWGYIREQAAEQYSKTFDTYQRVWMPAGYYTVAGYAMDRRGSWTDVIKNDADWRAEDATWLYAKVGDGDTLQTQVFNAKSVAQTWDLTEGTGNIYSYDVDGVTWYAPNSMEGYRNWMDAKGDFIFGTALQFYVPEATYASLGFFRRAIESSSWFAIDDIKLYYAVDDYPVIDMDPVEPEEEGDYIIDCSKTFRGGVVSADRKKANAGESVTFTAVPNTNFYLDGMTLELTVEAEDAQARPVNQSRVAVLTTVELPMTYDAETGVYTGVYEMTNSNVTLVAANFMPKQAQKIVAEDVNVYETAVDVAVVAENQTEGGAALRYAVAEGNDVVEVNAETGALTILKSGIAVIEITADETEKCKKTTATVNVIIKAVVKKTVTLVRGMATFYDPINAYVIPEDAKVWTGQVDASQEAVIMSEITGAIPAATPVLITGESATVTLTPDLENADEPVVSDLKPTDDFKDRIMDGSENVYALHYGAFIHVTSGSMPAGKAYINYEKFGGNNGARLAIIFDEETGIANVKAKDAGDDNSPIFDLMGRRLARKPASGYYIQNGVRYFVK